MNIIRGDEYFAKIIKCRWCHEDIEIEKAKFWVTGARICEECYKEAEVKTENMRKEISKKIYRGTLNAGW